MLNKNLLLLLLVFGFALPAFGMHNATTKEDLFEGLEFFEEDPRVIAHESHDSWELSLKVYQDAQDEDQAPQAMDTTEDSDDKDSVKAYICAMLAVSGDLYDLFPAPDLDDQDFQAMEVFEGLDELVEDQAKQLATDHSLWNAFPEFALEEKELFSHEFNAPILPEQVISEFKAPYRKRLKLVP